jgi:hypothetical protein
VHRHHFDIAVFGIVLGSAIIVTVISVLAGLRLRRRVFAGTARDEWQDARRRLDRKARVRVWWATMRRRPVGSLALAPAQLALSFYAQDTAERTPLVSKTWARWGLPVLYGVLAINYAVQAILQAASRTFDWVFCILFTCLALLWALYVPRSLARQPQRMGQLREEIKTRHGELPA